MKKIFTFLTAILLTTTLWAQSPETISYQAVIRSSSNALVTNSQVGMQITILHGSASGTVVYVETQTPFANANGLVSIQIGNGSAVIGDFSAIDWANGPYFIKTETDLEGNTSYTITGVSQFLSVPYALHAKTAETVTGGISETDPIFSIWDKSSGIYISESQISDLGTYIETETDPFFNISVASDITATDITNWNNKQDRLISGTGISIVGNTINSAGGSTGSPLAIGQSYQGGIIFWLDETGQHGLVAATTDQSSQMGWYNGTLSTTNAVRNGIGAGMYNTERIILNQGPGSYAAQLCSDFKGGGYGDWYLPSIKELNLLFQQKDVVGGFSGAFYWSSTEHSDGVAWRQSFYGSGEVSYFQTNKAYFIRAIRSF